MTIELRQVVSSFTGIFRDRYKDLPVIRTPLVMSESDGEMRELGNYRDQVLETGCRNWYQVMRLADLDADMDTWHDWFPLPPWPVDDVGPQIRVWKEELRGD